MMSFAFDLISDLHVETWPQEFSWQGQATSPYCVVAGDVARDRRVLTRTLRHLAGCYRAVFYIDGNDEHLEHWLDLDASYQDISAKIRRIKDVVYMQNNVIIIDGVALLATNGWWGFDFDGNQDYMQSATWYHDRLRNDMTLDVVDRIRDQSHADAAYLTNSIRRIQTHGDVRHIVLITHTVPNATLITHDIELAGSHKFNCMGNALMPEVLTSDLGHKVHTWCFGHYHMPVDQTRNGIRYVNNCRGRGDSAYRQWAYQPKRIEIG
jgi:predicted phosphodiesterase